MTTDHLVSEQTYQYFAQESAELLQTMDRELQALRQDFSLQQVYSLMRAAHTLKGASASVGLDALKKTTHSLEGIFKALCYPDTVITVEIESLIFEGYDCLQLLLSSELSGAEADEADILDRMANVVAQLQGILGDRFGQEGHLPTSSELGFDMTQSIFEVGVSQRIDALAAALKNPDPEELVDLLCTQADIFIGLGESLDLPGFQEIAKVALQAVQERPEKVLEIAPVALENFRLAQMAVLGGDRTQGGTPSAALQQFCNGTQHVPVEAAQSAVAIAASPSSVSPSQGSWLKRRWQMLTHPLGGRTERLTEPVSVSRCDDSTQLENRESLAPNEMASVDDSPLSESAIVDREIAEESALYFEEIAEMAASELTVLELAELAPQGLETLDIEPVESTSLYDSPSALDVSQGKQDVANEQMADSATQWSATDSPDTAAQREGNKGATTRIGLRQLDQLSQTMGELLTHQNRQALYNEQLTGLTKRLLNRISQQQQQLNRQKDQHLIHQRFSEDADAAPPTQPLEDSAYAQFDTLELDRYDTIQLLLQSGLEEAVQQSESAEAIDLFVRRSRETLDKQKRLLAQTREMLIEARMVSLGTIFNRLYPTLQRLQSQDDKQVEMKIAGGDVVVDKAIADNLYEPLLHLVRNAFDHGLEPPEQRLAQGKSIAGDIRIEGVQQGRHLLISVKDDGRGIDLERVRRRAIKNQIITPAEAETLTPEQTVDLLFEPGFSTLKEADSVSGRGVGLDVVRAKMRSLQGWVSVDHEPTAGTCFTLQIPATLTIAKLLLCQSQGRLYALIADAVKHILIPTSQQIRAWKGGKMLTWQMRDREYLVPVNALDEVLHYASPASENRLSESWLEGKPGGLQSEATRPVVLLNHQDALVGLEVDQLLDEQELVISPLGQTILPPAYLYGSSILPDGQLTLVLDGVMLAKIISEQRKANLEVGEVSDRNTTPPLPSDKPVFLKKLILTVDDSITVRSTLAEALQRANYQVVQARDGTEALAQLARYPDVQAILCDIEMPGMNGFEFLKARQKMPKIAAIPTVMLTSRTGSKHRLLTEELGATTYITKPYLTPQLLNVVAEAIAQHARPRVSTVGESYE